MSDEQLRLLERAKDSDPGDLEANRRWSLALKRQGSGDYLPVRYSPMTFAVWSLLPSMRAPGRSYMALLVYERHTIGGRDEIVTEPMVAEPSEESEITRWLGVVMTRPPFPVGSMPFGDAVRHLDAQAEAQAEAYRIMGERPFSEVEANRIMGEMGTRARQHWDRLAAQILEGNPGAYDGQPFFASPRRPWVDPAAEVRAEEIFQRIQQERDLARDLGIPPLPRRRR